MDVHLDEGGNQIYVALDGYGVFAATAPHRFLALRAVSAADYAERPAAPGAIFPRRMSEILPVCIWADGSYSLGATNCSCLQRYLLGSGTPSAARICCCRSSGLGKPRHVGIFINPVFQQAQPAQCGHGIGQGDGVRIGVGGPKRRL